MSKIRINELARELEVKPGKIIDLLPELGVDDKKTHSSSLDHDLANSIRKHFGFDAVEMTAEEEAAAAAEEHEFTPPPVAPSAPPAPAPAVMRAPETPPAPAVAAPEPPPAPPVQAQEAPRPVTPPVSVTPQPPPPPAAPRPVAPPVVQSAPPPPPTQLSEDRPRIPIAPPLRPPLAGVRPSAPTIPVPKAAPAPPQPAPAAPAPPAQQQGSPQQPAQPAPPPRVAMPLRPPPGPAVPGAPAPPPPPRPGQILSGPRQPLPSSTPGMPPPAPRPPLPRPAPAATPGTPAPPRPPQPPPAGGQLPARPVVPPRPDMVERLRQQQQVRSGPGQPAPPRPGTPQPQVRQGSGGPLPGQPIYRGPVRPGMPVVRGPGMPGMPGPGGPGGPPGLRPPRGRGMHPTTPLPPAPDQIPTTDTRRQAAKPGHKRVVDREAEEGRLRPVGGHRREEPVVAVNKEITIGEGITVKELSEKLGIKASLVIKRLVDKKIFATINQTLDLKLAEDIAASFGAASSHMSFEEEATWEVELAEDTGDNVVRAPVVTVMGHVDHGKTSLLDAIRSADVASHEAGGITQHIGAYQITRNNRKIVFIDTPGHEAFTRMRARGAKVTDIVVLVVAADDGVMPQTLEAIDHARAAKVPIVVAINKIDRPDATPDRIKQQLADRGLLAEDWGGDTPMIPVSAKTQQNVDLLLENVLLVADLQELKANPNRPGLCTVLEAKLDRGRGPVATVLVRNGTLRVGDPFICGTVFSKVRALVDDHGQSVKEAEPATPVEVLGFDSLPDVGDTLQVVTDTGKAKQIVVFREQKAREIAMAKSKRLTLESLHQQLKEGEQKELNIIIKADVGGSAEVLSETLQKLSTDKVRIKVIHTGVGAITESDVLLATASEAIVIGFNVRPERTAAQVAEQESVDIRLHTIIYDLTQEIKRAMAGLLEPVIKETYKGRAEVREVFKISKVGTVAGCYVLDGSITRGSNVRLLRDNIVVHTGKIEGLRRFKDDVSEVKTGMECGISLHSFSDVKNGDIFEAFVLEKIAQDVA